VHAGDADDRRPDARNPALDRSAKAQVDDRRRVASRLKRCRDVLEAERLGPKERRRTESFVDGCRADQEHIHTWAAA
jgi:hypothetical protein